MIYIEQRPPEQDYECAGCLYSVEVTTDSQIEYEETVKILQEFQEELRARMRRKVQTL